jgi:DNA-binding transcriptional regulator YdaS (Cro superfamily)
MSLANRRKAQPLHQLSPTRRAIALAGGPTSVANVLDLTPQAVSRWVAADRIPAKWVLAVEELIRFEIPRHELRPDIYPHPFRARSAIDPKWLANNPQFLEEDEQGSSKNS